MSLLTRLVFPKPAQMSRGLWGRQDLHGRISGGYKVPSAQLFANIKQIPKYVNWLTLVLVASHHLTCGREMPIQPCREINAKLVIRLSGSVTLQTSGHLHALSWGSLYSLTSANPVWLMQWLRKKQPSSVEFQFSALKFVLEQKGGWSAGSCLTSLETGRVVFSENSWWGLGWEWEGRNFLSAP